jgi:hypothetical protein
MPVKKGTRLGGVRDRDSLRDHCVVDDETGCWRWACACTDGKPAVYFVFQDGRRTKMRGRRVALLVRRGRDLSKGVVAYPVPACPHDDCVLPEHAQEGSRRDASRAAAARGAFSSPARIATMLHYSALRQKLSDAQRLEIATSEGPTMDAVRQFGVSPKRVRDLRRGEFGSRRCATSVFDWRPA